MIKFQMYTKYDLPDLETVTQTNVFAQSLDYGHRCVQYLVKVGMDLAHYWNHIQNIKLLIWKYFQIILYIEILSV